MYVIYNLYITGKEVLKNIFYIILCCNFKVFFVYLLCIIFWNVSNAEIVKIYREQNRKPNCFNRIVLSKLKGTKSKNKIRHKNLQHTIYNKHIQNHELFLVHETTWTWKCTCFIRNINWYKVNW